MSVLVESNHRTALVGLELGRSTLVDLASQITNGAEQDPKADVCVCNFLTTVEDLHTPEAEVFLSLHRVGKVDVIVPKVADVEDFNRVTATVDVRDLEGEVHTEVLVNPIVWSDAKLFEGESNPAKGVVVSSCAREVGFAVRSVLSRGI